MKNSAQKAEHSQLSLDTSLTDLTKDALWGICLCKNKQIIATHWDLAILRRCAKLVASNPDQIVHIIAPGQTRHTHYIETSLIHLGVSISQIQHRSTGVNSDSAEGIWLLVAGQI